MKKIAILGCGQLGSIVDDAVASGLLPDYALCAAMSRKLPDAEALCAKAGGVACATLEEVLAQKPDYVIETAAEIHTHTGPASLKNTPLFTDELMTTPEKTVLAGTAAEAIRVLPADGSALLS